MKKKSILFVCTGNIFRSLSAEYAFKKYLSDHKIKGWDVSSAGIIAKKEPADPKTLEVLKDMGVKNIDHRQKKLTRKMLHDYDVIVAIAENHYHFIRSEFNYDHVLLFNELAIDQKTSIWDIEDDVPDYKTNRKAMEKKIEKTIKYIFKNTPALFRSASERFYLFSDFVDKKRDHNNGYPFMTLYETKKTIAFMSIDIPQKEDGHIIVIPKKRYWDLSQLPSYVLHELIHSVQKIGSALHVNHGGYNILLNNGSDAGQYIFHTHFHVIPRNSNDEIKIEVWDRRKISLRKFIALNEKLKGQINSV